MRPSPIALENIIFNHGIQSKGGVDYLSSNLFVGNIHSVASVTKPGNRTLGRQGPSIEYWDEYDNKSEEGTDSVIAIHCNFWPNVAAEWIQRQRHFGWPTSRDISSIVDFGCHLVPVGHPHSETKLMEWRFSFSVAERTLVWSFNHAQIQCYAVMKIILKEFIKIRCSEENQVLCSYFVKTFLFWKFETTEVDFWTGNNFRECINYLLAEFSKCVREGVLSHYFLPKFNLLSVKLTEEAQTELLQLLDCVVQSDISFMANCKTLKNVWFNFLSSNKNQMGMIHRSRRMCLNQEDKLMMIFLTQLTMYIDTTDAQHRRYHDTYNMVSRCLGLSRRTTPSFFSLEKLFTVPCSSHLKSIFLKRLQLNEHLKSFELCFSEGKELSMLQEIVSESTSFDISTSKLWYAVLLLKKCDYTSTLDIVNQVLSSIPPFALHLFESDSSESKHLYVDKFLHSSCTTIQRARKAWLMEFTIPTCVTKILPLAFQTEQYFCSNEYSTLYLSPYICAYYFMFLCYHELGQYENRDRALQHLLDFVSTNQTELFWYRNFNIAGNCLLIARRIDEAREMFVRSKERTRRFPAEDKRNSANWYIENFCSANHWC